MNGVLLDKQLNHTCREITSLKQVQDPRHASNMAGGGWEGSGVEGRRDRGWGGYPAFLAAALLFGQERGVNLLARSHF